MSMSEQAALNTCSKDNAITLLRKEVCRLKGEVNRLNRLLTHERGLTNVGDKVNVKT
jgi:hypothetical protein